MSKLENWELKLKDHIGYVTLVRAQTNNDISLATLLELRELVLRLSVDDQIWVVVIQGDGAHFSSGMELQVFIDRMESPGTDLAEFIRMQQACLEAWQRLPKVTIAKIRGFCIGGGLLLALCCDFRVASARTILSLPEIRLGILPYGGQSALSNLLGLPEQRKSSCLESGTGLRKLSK